MNRKVVGLALMILGALQAARLQDHARTLGSLERNVHAMEWISSLTIMILGASLLLGNRGKAE